MVVLDIENLRNRWTPELLRIGIRFLRGESEPPFPCLETGQVDLRGIRISEIIKNTSFSDADLSGCFIDGFGQFDVRPVLRSSFSEAELSGNLGRDFQECNFTRASLKGMVLRGIFLNCIFNQANLTSVMGDGIQFIRCRFIKTNFKKATLTHCLFEDCVFAENKFGSGSLTYSRFINSPITLIELGNTLMEKVIINGSIPSCLE